MPFRSSYIISLLSFLLILHSVTYSQPVIKAKIGILAKANNKIVKLKSFDRLRPGDELRVCAQSSSSLFFYAILSDQKTATLLNYKQSYRLTKNKNYFLPSESEFYQLDDNSAKIKITLICTAKKIDAIDGVFKSSAEIPLNSWIEHEKVIVANAKKDISDNSDKPFTMAGNVRGVNDDFFDKLLPLTADKTIIRIFEVEVKK